MARVKCPICGIWFNSDTEENVPYKHRYYHKKCFELLGKEDRDKADLASYIITLFNYKSTGPVINAQIKKYHDELGYTYSGIKKSLMYFYEIKHNEVENNAVGIGIVPYVYAEAKRYYYELYLIQKGNQGVGSVAASSQTVYIERPERTPLHHAKKIIIKEGES